MFPFTQVVTLSEIVKTKRLYLIQNAYIRQLLCKHHMQYAKTVATPMDVNIKLQRGPEGYKADLNMTQGYQNLFGGLIWPAM